MEDSVFPSGARALLFFGRRLRFFDACPVRQTYSLSHGMAKW